MIVHMKYSRTKSLILTDNLWKSSGEFLLSVGMKPRTKVIVVGNSEQLIQAKTRQTAAVSSDLNVVIIFTVESRECEDERPGHCH